MGGKELSAALIIDHFQAEKSPLFLDSNQLVYEALIHGIKSVLFDVVTPPCIHSSVRFSTVSRVTHAHNDRVAIQLLVDLLRFPPFYLLPPSFDNSIKAVQLTRHFDKSNLVPASFAISLPPTCTVSSLHILLHLASHYHPTNHNRITIDLANSCFLVLCSTICPSVDQPFINFRYDPGWSERGDGDSNEI